MINRKMLDRKKIMNMRKRLLIFVFLIYNISIFGQQTIKNQLDYFDLITSINNYKNEITESYHYIRSWVFIDKLPNTLSKNRLIVLHEKGIVQLKEKLNSFEFLFDSIDRTMLADVKFKTDRLLEEQKKIMSLLDNYEAYNDPIIMFEIMPTVEDQGDLCLLKDSLIDDLDALIFKKKMEYVDLIERQISNQPLIETQKIKRIKNLLNLLNTSNEIKEILALNDNSALRKMYLEKDIYEILIKKYDKYYSLNEINDLIVFYKTKTGKRVVKVSKKMMLETLKEIIDSMN